MSKRFAIVIGVAAAGLMALGAQTAAASDVVKYDTKLTISRDRCCLYHGYVKSEVWKCEAGRRVVLFDPRPGADRKLGTSRAGRSGSRRIVWGVEAHVRGPVYAKVRRTEGDRFVCRADRTPLCRGGCGGVARASAAARSHRDARLPLSPRSGRRGSA